jgi:hypothetical protein
MALQKFDSVADSDIPSPEQIELSELIGECDDPQIIFKTLDVSGEFMYILDECEDPLESLEWIDRNCLPNIPTQDELRAFYQDLRRNAGARGVYLKKFKPENNPSLFDTAQ